MNSQRVKLAAERISRELGYRYGKPGGSKDGSQQRAPAKKKIAK